MCTLMCFSLFVCPAGGDVAFFQLGHGLGRTTEDRHPILLPARQGPLLSERGMRQPVSGGGGATGSCWVGGGNWGDAQIMRSCDR